MKKLLLTLAILCFFSGSAQVTQIWTDYSTFWTSSSSSINAVKPNTAHDLLAFRWNGTNYSTGVNNAKLAANSVTYTATKFRGLPINSVPLTGPSSAYFIGLGALVDGLATTVDNGSTNPFAPITTGIQKATYLTKGTQGLDLGSCLTNIPSGTPIRFNLSSNGITWSNVGDGIPDILISQVAQPSTTAADKFKFVNSSGVTVGNEISVLLSSAALYPTVGNWNVDFYENNSTQTTSTFVNTERTLKFYATDLSAFGITAGNYANAVALIYTPGGDSDPAFLAFNEPSLGVSTQLGITAQPTTSACDGTMASSFTVRLEDRNGLPVEQAGISITASMATGPGNLLGTLTATTDVFGVATFSTLSFEVGGDHQIRFSNSSLDAAITTNIIGDIACGSNIWTGNGANNNWSNTANWQTAFVPNANTDVTIPTGRPRYPVLQGNAGAKNITLGVNTTITLNGRTFAISGTITKDASAKIIASTDNSVLYFSGSSAQTIPSGLILSGDIANLTIENTAGVTNADALKITQVLLVREGAFATGSSIDLVCRFSPKRTAQIGPIGSTGSITGNVTVEQCFPARRAFRFLTSSVTTSTSIRANWQEGASAWNANPKPGYGTHITGLGASGPSTNDGVNGFDWQPSGASSMFTFNNGTQAWSAVGSTTGVLTAGVPYRMLIRGSRSTDIQLNASAPTNTILRSTGTILKGPVAVTGLSSTSNAYNLVGNPFQTIVDMNQVISNATNVKSIYYVYDPTLGGSPTVGESGGRGAYVSVNALTGVKSNALSGVTNFLQPYQAFYIQTNTLGSAPTITFREDYKSTSSTHTNVFRSPNENGEVVDNQFITLSLSNQESFNSNESASDGLRIDFSSNANNGVDDYDAVKFTNSDENISRKIGENLISMETRGNAENGDLLPLNITQYRSTAYIMEFSISDFTGQEVYLKDYYTNESTLLAGGTPSMYSFTVSDANPTSKSADRFAIEIQQAPLGVENPKFNSAFSLYPNPSNGESIFLNSKTSFENAKIEVYNVLGQRVSALNADFGSNNQISIPIADLSVGVYLISVTTNTGEKFSSKFIKN
ncbi:T9SS type A sorting domain-containing protein [Flavobacterium sp. SM2513]|uniref:T9SS type A sorting domain-containing protein n=1 Tax=Flavobacterium sp. SM2513 TaxID=3424766 RepID=UPI003D7FE7D0